MNSSTIVGIIASLILLFGAVWLSADQVGIFLNLPGFFIVVLGTVAATLISYPMREVLRVFRVLGIVLRQERHLLEDLVDDIVAVSRLASHGQLKKIEDHLDQVENPFLRTGVQLVIDGTSAEDIINLLEWRISRMQAREQADAQLFHSMAHFAPAFGMLGTLVGLVNMLVSVGVADIDQIAGHMALALMTTLYGIVLANLIFKPVALKLERRTETRVMLMNMALEGILMLREKRSPSFVKQTLRSFAEYYEDELKETPGTARPAPQT